MTPTVRPPRLGTAQGGRRSFTAAYAGSCASCPAAILPGDSIFYASGSASPSGLDCCGDKSDADLAPPQYRESDPVDEDPAVEIARVLPRGRTARHACPRCYMIPASNGVCDCV